ncbi:hypothetical protein SAPIO_CDS4480 [Scedosporium apiospermum]|uniref:Uncharacterized protein n=1 Tax=Pseudallescheria apiosperma TaxID=563466 RepID=A0A084G898_PSEDA|nr:uncharacterized protein SAPIO_CDS4480 [Scedosporium apiospermum]KEZ43560.1 hypothetical protein SAPIO_CDS4480 [Scedosporium apiospermum]
MVQIFTTAAALLALASIGRVASAPTEPQGNVTFVSRTLEEARALSELFKRDGPAEPASLESRQVPAFGAYFENWAFQGAGFYHRANIDNKGYYIGDEWNNRISSIQNFDYDKKCTYWTDWDGNSACYGVGIVLAGRVEYAYLDYPFNDAISCRQCGWN